ncbi:MAG: V/A-type H+-transporting ATPase subunit I [Halovenus sp.]|jgi:V/A-type H+-transporting ATPase subunit I
MLRPEQMSKVSVTGARSVMEQVIETMHGMHVVHITDYDGSWEGFEPGEPLPGSDETSSTLVTVRAIESILDVEPDDATPRAAPDLSNADERLEEIRVEVNDLDDRRDELRDRLRTIDERRDRMAQFAGLGLELDLLWGYDSLDVLVGEGNPAAIRAALAESDDVAAHDVFHDGDTVAAFASTTEDGTLSDAMVGVPFTAFEVPEESGDPSAVVADLESERRQVEAELERIESELEALKADSAGFLLALEESLSIDAQKSEAPLRFATTERSFVVEGWVPTDRYDAFRQELSGAVDGRIEVDEIERARHTGSNHVARDTVDDAGRGAGQATATDGGTTSTREDRQATPDGGRAVAGDGVVTVDDDPPVRQENPGILSPFELLTKALNRPKYSEFDPTFVLFLTFPLFFGFMVGDIGYGLVYMLIGYAVTSRFDSQGIVNFGTIVVWLGLFTAVFGILYGEILGLHFFEWFDLHAPIEKGISDTDWAITWIMVAVLAGIAHLNLAYLFEFVEEYQLHSTKQAIAEVGSWLLMLNGLWIFIFSKTFDKSKPDLLIDSDLTDETVAVLDAGPLGFGFNGFPELVGWAGFGLLMLGLFVLVVFGPTYEAVEFAVPFAHVLSYTRLTAVLLAKAGMALAANLLYWGVYEDSEGFHYIHAKTTEEVAQNELIFGGLANMGTGFDLGPLSLGVEGALLGIPVFIVAHAVVLAIGGTAGIQAIRLEYFEFFEKFYEGGGRKYKPFGYDRAYTTDT